MYNVVFSKEVDGCFASVFDQKGNEVYNTEALDGLELAKNVKAQKFKIENYITSYEDYGRYIIWSCTPDADSFLTSSNNVPLPINEDKPIANESFHGYGLNRYLHRQFLKLTR